MGGVFPLNRYLPQFVLGVGYFSHSSVYGKIAAWDRCISSRCRNTRSWICDSICHRDTSIVRRTRFSIPKSGRIFHDDSRRRAPTNNAIRLTWGLWGLLKIESAPLMLISMLVADSKLYFIADKWTLEWKLHRNDYDCTKLRDRCKSYLMNFDLPSIFQMIDQFFDNQFHISADVVNGNRVASVVEAIEIDISQINLQCKIKDKFILLCTD